MLTFLVLGAAYCFQALGLCGFIALSLIGSGYDRPWMILTFSALWPVSVPLILLRDLLRR